MTRSAPLRGGNKSKSSFDSRAGSVAVSLLLVSLLLVSRGTGMGGVFVVRLPALNSVSRDSRARCALGAEEELGTGAVLRPLARASARSGAEVDPKVKPNPNPKEPSASRFALAAVPGSVRFALLFLELSLGIAPHLLGKTLELPNGLSSNRFPPNPDRPTVGAICPRPSQGPVFCVDLTERRIGRHQ